MQADRTPPTGTEAAEIAAAIAADAVEQAQEQAKKDEKPRPRGRRSKGSDHQEPVIELSVLNPLAIETMIADYKNVCEAKTIFGESIKAWAEKAGIQAGVLRTYIVARAGESFDNAKRDALQLSLLFEEIKE